MILLEPPSAIKFGFGVPGIDANREVLNYVDSKHEMTALLKSLEDEEFERIEAQ